MTLRGIPKGIGIYASIAVFALFCIPLLALGQQQQGPPAPGLVRCNDNCDFTDLVDLAKRIINFLIYVIAVPIATVLFVWAGFLYVTSGGDPGKVKKAHGIFKNVAGGLIIALGAWLIVNLLTTVLTGDSVTDVFTP